jgi:septal ring factor EnvC (AmiA/AmiB activator)
MDLKAPQEYQVTSCFLMERLMQLRVQVDKRFNSTDQQLAELKQELAGVRQEVAGVQTTLAQILARLPEKP